MKKTILKECMRIAVDKMETRPKGPSNAHHFSFVIVDNKIVECGSNRLQDVPVHWGYDIEFQGLHSEMCAYIKARGLMKGKEFEMVNIRLNRDLHMRLSRPCPNCQRMMHELGCKTIWYTTNDDIEKMRL